MASNLSLLFLFHLLSLFANTCNSSPSSEQYYLSKLTSICRSTPHPDHCISSSKLSLSLNLPPTLLSTLLRSLETAISDTTKLSSLFSSPHGLVEKQKGTLQDCKELHQITLSTLQRSISRVKSSSSFNPTRHTEEARTFLSAALTNKATCLDGLASASGPLKPALVNSVVDAYKHVANSLSLLSKAGPTGPLQARKFPSWVSRKARRALEVDIGSDVEEVGVVVTVAKDGTGNFSTVGEAVGWVPTNSVERVVIYVKEGVYEENVEITSNKTNIVLVGDGTDSTVITGNRSVPDGWTTFRSATVAVSGDGFLARDITFANSAGPGKYQAVALRINADLSAVYRCSIEGYQDTLYVHSFRQFYRECDIYGTIDFIFGNAIVVIQASNIFSRLPLLGQSTVMTAQSRDTMDENTGMVIQNCSILGSGDLYSSRESTALKSYLGRPWRVYARTVVMESYIDDFIDPAGWSRWSGEQGLDTLYYGEYDNYGPGSDTGGRVKWSGYHVMDYQDATNFTVSEFITGDDWLQSTSFPYDDGV